MGDDRAAATLMTARITTATTDTSPVTMRPLA